MAVDQHLLDQHVVRDYRPEDDAAINELEKRASQHRYIPIVSDLFKASLRHIVRFDLKAAQFDSYHILCVEDAVDGTLCGVVVCGCKLVWLQGRQRKCGYIYDLRIHENYQRRGLGLRLSEAVEARAREAEVEFLYLTVNSNNEPAKVLYQRLGFLHASHRFPMAALVVRPVGEPPVELQMLKAAEALPIFEKALARRDMSLVSLGPLFKSSLFEVAILASDSESGSAAGACLWNMGSFSNPHIEQLIIPTTWYTFTSTKLVLLAGGLLLDLWAARGVWGFWSQGLTLSFCLALSAAVAVNAAVVWAVFWVRHLGEWVLGRKQKTRARLFAASAQGPRGPELLRAVVARAQNAAQERGYLMLICNLDEADPLRSCFGSGRFRTEFLQKALVDNLQVRDFAPDNFHDPRDI